MRLVLLFLFLVAGLGSGYADPPQIDSTSPDQRWRSTACWVKSGISSAGYAWDLRDVKTGKIYFHEDKIPDDEDLPQRLYVQWSPDSHYAAVTFYYGRAMQGVMVIPLTVAKPDLIDPMRNNSKIPLEKTLVHKEDLPSFTGYNRLLTGADRWINNTDLSVEIDMLAFLKDKKSGQKSTLSAHWHQTVHFGGASCKVIDSTCDSYDITPDSN